jgi:hypothetical protein
MSLEIISGSLYKFFVNLEAFGRDGGFATDQDKKTVRATPMCIGIQRLTGLRQ